MNHSSTRWLLLAFSALGVYYATSVSGVPQEFVADCAAGSVAERPLTLRAPTPYSLRLVDLAGQEATATVRLERIPDASEETVAPPVQNLQENLRTRETPTMVRFSEIDEFQGANVTPSEMVFSLPSILRERNPDPEHWPNQLTDEPVAQRTGTTDPAAAEPPTNPRLAFALSVHGDRIQVSGTPEKSTADAAKASDASPSPRGPMEIVMPKAVPPSSASSARGQEAVTPASESAASETETVNAEPQPRRSLMHFFDAAAGSLEVAGPIGQLAEIRDGGSPDDLAEWLMSTTGDFVGSPEQESAVVPMEAADTDPVLTRRPITRTDLAPRGTTLPLAVEQPSITEPRPPLGASDRVNKPNNRPNGTEVSREDRTWKPLDIKSIELVTPAAIPARPEITEATPQDKLLAQDSLRMAFESAQKRMYFSARSRFIETTRVIARSLDDQSGRSAHSQSLRVALQAYEEAADFFPQATRFDQEVDLAAIVSGHDTQLLQSANPRDLTPRQCLREYMALAEQEFVRALKHDPLGSQALYGLGRLQSVADSGIQQSSRVSAHRSIMLFQTALRIDPNNFAAANELGVLLARYGQYPAAIASLQHSVQVSPQPAAWMNLARVHEKLGQAQEARLASQRAAELADTRAPSPITLASRPQIQWVDARTFAQVPDDQAASDQVVRNPPPRSSVPEQGVATPEKKKLKPWFWRD